MTKKNKSFHMACRLCRLLFTTCVPLAMLLPAAAQNDANEDVLLDLLVNYGVAFREGSWVPVDVLVNNTKNNVDGFVEVRTYDVSGTLQSPVYRVPANSPKGSRKRFRLHCKLERSDRLEARIYDGNRPVSPIPARINLTPINRNDYLGLVLDDLHHDYGFLSSGKVIGRSDTRFHREGLDSTLLGYLADHLPCYTTFDLIVLGNVELEKISPYHRELLLQYVSLGGSLVVNLGQNASQYKGTWIEPLLGVTIGENEFISEEVLAQRAFGSPEDHVGASATREGPVTRISADTPNATPIGANFSLGAINPLGAGRIATFTVDATSGMMQNNDAYLKAWNGLLGQSIVDRPLNLPAAIEAATLQLPSIAGVKLFPVSSVIAYLLLYFFIAIVANWLFWNWMKRREMAWVCLVFFSFSFTAYAMIFGTQGRARTTELEQLEILELSAGTPVATMYGITGLLAKGSGRFDAVLAQPGSLVADAARTPFLGMQQPGGIFGPQSESPFQFLQADTSRINGLKVGASEMRFLQTQAPISLEGAIESDLALDDTGISGVIHNNTGIELANPMFLHEGNATRLLFENGKATISSVPSGHALEKRNTTLANVPPSSAITAPADMNNDDYSRFSTFLTQISSTVLSHRGAALPPCLVAWANREPFGSLDMGSDAQIRLGATLVVAWLDVNRDTIPSEQQLAVYVWNETHGQGTYAPMPEERIASEEAWKASSMFIAVDSAWEVDIAIPDWIRNSNEYTLELTVRTDDSLYDGSDQQFYAIRNDLENDKLDFKINDSQNKALPLGTPVTTEAELGNQCTLTTKIYTVDDWKSVMPPRTTALSLVMSPENVSYSPGTRAIRGQQPMYNNSMYSQPTRPYYSGRHYRALVTARLILSNPKLGV